MGRRTRARLTAVALLIGLALAVAAIPLRSAAAQGLKEEARRQRDLVRTDLANHRWERAYAGALSCIRLDAEMGECWGLRAEAALNLDYSTREEQLEYEAEAEVALRAFRKWVAETGLEKERLRRLTLELRARTAPKLPPRALVFQLDLGGRGAALGSPRLPGRASGFGGLATRLVFGFLVRSTEASVVLGADVLAGGPPASLLVEPVIGLHVDVEPREDTAVWMFMEVGLSPSSGQPDEAVRTPVVFRVGAGPRFEAKDGVRFKLAGEFIAYSENAVVGGGLRLLLGLEPPRLREGARGGAS